MRKANRYGSRARDGYRSGFEGQIADSLTARGVPFGYESEKIAYEKPARKATYNPDFLIQRKNGSTIYVEAKGYMRSTDRQKMKAVKASNPDLDIRFVFAKPQLPINKGSKTTYARWAEDAGFPWAEGDVPDAWTKE